MDWISVREAARWLATMAARDGVVSPNERKLLREFALEQDLDPHSLYRMAHAIAGGVEVPEVELVSRTEMLGRRFEKFVVELCSDKSRFRLLAWRGDKIAGDVYALENLLPDLRLRHRLDSGVAEYYVECKYRSVLPDGELCIGDQLRRYRGMLAAVGDSELFIAVGVGGTPDSPEKFYVIPARSIKRDGVVRLGGRCRWECEPSGEALHERMCRYFAQRQQKGRREEVI